MPMDQSSEVRPRGAAKHKHNEMKDLYRDFFVLN